LVSQKDAAKIHFFLTCATFRRKNISATQKKQENVYSTTDIFFTFNGLD
jgi:hypothetical protein